MSERGKFEAATEGPDVIGAAGPSPDARESDGQAPLRHLQQPEQLLLRVPRTDASPAVVPMRADGQAVREPLRILVLGATSGIAQQCQRLWAERGDSLFLVARDADKLAAVVADCATRGLARRGAERGTAAAGARVDSAVADLDDTAGHASLLAHAINRLGGLDLAVIAMGSLGDQGEGERDFGVAARSLHTNFVAPVSLLTWLGNYCTQRRAGTLAVFSSVAGERGRKSNYIYGSAKAGLTAFLSGLRNRIDREGVRVVTIKPGPVRTAMTEQMAGSARFADAGAVAAGVVRALDGRGDVVYVPVMWRWIMAVVRAVPEGVFKGRDW